ncbi:MAG: GIDE domain-containing protein [Pedobacter sp.]
MTQPSPTYLLIAQSIPSDNEKLAQLRPLLARKYQLDTFLLQQRLIGRGPNLIAEGSQERLEGIAALLTEQDIRCWIIESRPPRFTPLRLRGLRTGNGQLSLLTDERVVTLDPEHRIMAILADLSGEAAAKNLKYLMAQHVYSGIRDVRPLSDEELTRAILRGKPVLDLYRFNDLGRVDAGVRILPGRFDPSGLGEHATLSAIGNLKIVLELVRSHVQDARLVLDFGLANLPGCRLKNDEEGLHWQRDNLAALTRFGWLMTELAPSEAYSRDAAGAAPLPFFQALCQEIGDDIPASPPPAPAPASLPTPPASDGSHRSIKPQLTLGFAVATGFGLLTTIGNDLLATALKFGVRTAILPMILSGACLWGGFHFLRLKRYIENTPTSKARSLAMGLVELQGRAVRKYALVSPVGQLPCVFYRLRKYRRDSKNNWRLSHSTDSSHVPFYLEDETGKVTIDPRGASVSARERQESYGDRSTSLFGSIGSSDEKWVEEVVSEGAQLFILGQAGASQQARIPLRERVTKTLQELKRNPAALQHYDRNGDGHICETEWEHARSSIEQQVLQQSLTNEHMQPIQSDRVVIKRPHRHSIPFVIAQTESELHLVRNYTLLTVPLFAGALAGVTWTLMTLKDYLQP